MPDHDQFVNLVKDPKFVEDEVKSIERAGALHIEATMSKGISPNLLKVRVTPVSEPQTYTATETPRNTRFTLVRTRKQAPVSAKKFKIMEDIELPAAGGNKYKVEGKVKTASMRWNVDGAWNDVKDLYAGTLSGCKVQQ